MSKPAWRHVKTGHIYDIVTFALIEKDLTPVVVYRSRVWKNQVWIRPLDEFFDGRFETFKDGAGTHTGMEKVMG